MKRLKSKTTWRIALSLMPLLFVTACAQGMSSLSAPIECGTAIPSWPAAGTAVADEMDRACPIIRDDAGGISSTCPATDQWHGRLLKFKQQLDIAR